MVDRVISVDVKEITVLKNVTNTEPHFQGHFPENPVMPGALILEAMFQAGGLLLAHNYQVPKPTPSLLAQVSKAHFRKPVVPGDQLYLVVSLLTNMGSACMGNACKFMGKAVVDDIAVAEAMWLVMVPHGK